MALVTTKVMVGQKPTGKQLAEVELASSFPIVYNEDSPKSSEDAIAEFSIFCPLCPLSKIPCE